MRHEDPQANLVTLFSWHWQRAAFKVRRARRVTEPRLRSVHGQGTKFRQCIFTSEGICLASGWRNNIKKIKKKKVTNSQRRTMFFLFHPVLWVMAAAHFALWSCWESHDEKLLRSPLPAQLQCVQTFLAAQRMLCPNFVGRLCRCDVNLGVPGGGLPCHTKNKENEVSQETCAALTLIRTFTPTTTHIFTALKLTRARTHPLARTSNLEPRTPTPTMTTTSTNCKTN